MIPCISKLLFVKVHQNDFHELFCLKIRTYVLHACDLTILPKTAETNHVKVNNKNIIEPKTNEFHCRKNLTTFNDNK